MTMNKHTAVGWSVGWLIGGCIYVYRYVWGVDDVINNLSSNNDKRLLQHKWITAMDDHLINPASSFVCLSSSTVSFQYITIIQKKKPLPPLTFTLDGLSHFYSQHAHTSRVKRVESDKRRWFILKTKEFCQSYFRFEAKKYKKWLFL